MISDTLRITIPGPPQAKERPRMGKHGHVYTPDRTRRYETTVRWLALAAMARQGWSAWCKDSIGVTAHVYFGDARRRDADNVFKALADAMNHLVYADDSQIREHTVRTWVDPENPRVELEIRKLDPKVALKPPAPFGTTNPNVVSSPQRDPFLTPTKGNPPWPRLS